MGNALIVFTLPAFFVELLIYKNSCVEYALETLYKSNFVSIYSLITTLLRSNSLDSKKCYQITHLFFANKKNQNYFLKDNCFYQIICKYILAIFSQEIEVLVAHKVLQLPISKVSIEILRKFVIVSIVNVIAITHYY